MKQKYVLTFYSTDTHTHTAHTHNQCSCIHSHTHTLAMKTGHGELSLPGICWPVCPRCPSPPPSSSSVPVTQTKCFPQHLPTDTVNANRYPFFSAQILVHVSKSSYISSQNVSGMWQYSDCALNQQCKGGIFLQFQSLLLSRHALHEQLCALLSSTAL